MTGSEGHDGGFDVNVAAKIKRRACGVCAISNNPIVARRRGRGPRNRVNPR